ncbi:MAG TPA: SDR family oxidoreductase, partial [Gemmataceae bacterium]|nr:SDR family oxidoreductase [Gemmataceae bacterium]
GTSKTILVTGVTRGLGRAMTYRFIELGHTVVGCGRNPRAIEELRRAYGRPNDFEAVNVADDRQVEQWAARVLESHCPPDLLLNNAALINRNAPLWELSAEEFDEIIDVNVKGVANVLRQFLPAMVAQERGVVVNFSSGWGRSTAPEVAPYCATKYAIEGLTLALAQELPAGMAAVPLNPGIIDTDMLRTTWGNSASEYPSAEEWSLRAVPYLLQLGPKDNGKSLSVR